jgi:hypothetical protein
MGAKQGPNFLVCMPNRTKRILLAPTGWEGPRQGRPLGRAGRWTDRQTHIEVCHVRRRPVVRSRRAVCLSAGSPGRAAAVRGERRLRARIWLSVDGRQHVGQHVLGCIRCSRLPPVAVEYAEAGEGHLGWRRGGWGRGATVSRSSKPLPTSRRATLRAWQPPSDTKGNWQILPRFLSRLQARAKTAQRRMGLCA